MCNGQISNVGSLSFSNKPDRVRFMSISQKIQILLRGRFDYLLFCAPGLLSSPAFWTLPPSPESGVTRCSDLRACLKIFKETEEHDSQLHAVPFRCERIRFG